MVRYNNLVIWKASKAAPKSLARSITPSEDKEKLPP